MALPERDLEGLKKNLRQREKELLFLYRLNKSLASGYLEHLLGLIVNLTSELIDCQICSVMTLEAGGKELVVRATQSLDDAYIKKGPIQVDGSLSGLAILERRSFQWRDITREPRYQYPEIAAKLGLKALLSVPMMIRSRPIGVINFYTTTAHRFSADEVQLLETIASHAAFAIEREELTHRAIEAQRALEERKTIERAKGILMDKKRLSEARAYELLRKASMSSRKSMREVAEAIILAENLG